MHLLIGCLLLFAAIDLWQGGYLSASRGALIAAALCIVAARGGQPGRTGSLVAALLIIGSLSLAVYTWTA